MINKIISKIKRGELEFSQHAVNQTLLRKISIKEIYQIFYSGEIIEDYPEDKYGPSCLVLGFTDKNRPIHIHCSYPSRPKIKIITIYEPDNRYWIDYRVRRKSNE